MHTMILRRLGEERKRSLSAAIIILFILMGCAGPIVVTRPAIYGERGVPYCLPRTVLAVDIEVLVEETGDNIRPKATLSVSAQTVADASCHYILQHDTNDSSDDDLKIVVGMNGLLSSVASESTQQGRAIADAAVRTLVAVAKIAATEGLFGLQSTPAETPSRLKAVQSGMAAALRRVAGKRTVYIPLPDSLVTPSPSPTSTLAQTRTPTPISVATLHPFLEDASWTITASLMPIAGPNIKVSEQKPPQARARCLPTPVEGIVVKGLEPFIVMVTLSWDWDVPGTASVNGDDSDEAKWLRERAFRKGERGWGFHGPLMSAWGLTNLPDYAPVLVVPINRAMFVKTKQSVTFTNGTLANIDINRPSPIAAIATFPADVAEKIVELPAQLIQLRISNIQPAETLAAKKVEAEKAAQQAIDESVKQKTGYMNAYLDAFVSALEAKDKWQQAIGTNQEQPLKLAAAKAMNSANAAAQLAGVAVPFNPGDFPRFQ